MRSCVPLAVQAAGGTTANESKEVVEPTVEVVEEIDRMVVLPEIGDAEDAGEADLTEVLSVDQHPRGTGETDGMNELSEVVEDPGGTGETGGKDEVPEVGEAGGETDWMDALPEVVEESGENDRIDVLLEVQVRRSTGKTDRLDALSEIEDDGSEKDRMNVLSEVAEARGEWDAACVTGADWRVKRLSQRSWWLVAGMIGWTRCQRPVARLIGWMRCWRSVQSPALQALTWHVKRLWKTLKHFGADSLLARVNIWRGKMSWKGCWMTVTKGWTHCSSTHQYCRLILPASSVTRSTTRKTAQGEGRVTGSCGWSCGVQSLFWCCAGASSRWPSTGDL